MSDYVSIATVFEGGVRYDLVVYRVDPASFADGAPTTIQQEPKVVASKATPAKADD